MSGVCTKHEDCRNNPELGATCYARTPRAYTPEEVRDRLLDHLWVMVDYWEREERAPTARDKITGFMHSTLAALDGCSMALPGFLVTPQPHRSDKKFHQSRGENWFPTNRPDLGSLHEFMYQRGRK